MKIEIEQQKTFIVKLNCSYSFFFYFPTFDQRFCVMFCRGPALSASVVFV
jgi:hypothetical protein